MTKRWIGITIGALVLVAVGVGVVLAAGPGSTGPGTPAPDQRWEQMAAMHNSPAMQRMHAAMPEELRERCQELHDRMVGMMGGSGGMGPGMMGGSGGMGPGMMGGSGGIGPGMMGGSGGIGPGMMGPRTSGSTHSSHHPGT